MLDSVDFTVNTNPHLILEYGAELYREDIQNKLF
jgi:hypothetical protein